MANVYVRYPGFGATDGSSWANAYATLAAALTAKAAGDDFWLADDHAETQASAMTLTAPGTLASPNRIVCVDRAGSVPPVAADLRTTAKISTTGAFGMTRNGHAYVYGITFNNGNSGSPTLNTGTTASNWIMESCADVVFGTSGNTVYGSGTAATTVVRLKNCNVKFGGVSGIINTGGAFEWSGGAVDASGSAPTTLLAISSARTSNALIENVDLSFLGSGKTLVGATVMDGLITFKNCKLGASVTLAATPTGNVRIEFINCDSADTNYKNAIIDRYGTMTDETTIVRSGGATDGTTALAHKIVTTANAKFQTPFRSKPIMFWNESTSAITITLQGIWGGGAVPNNDDIWVEAFYSGDASSPIGSIASCAKASILATNAALSAGAGTWGGSTTKFKLNVTITPANKGPITLVVKAGAASSTFYIDPKPVVT